MDPDCMPQNIASDQGVVVVVLLLNVHGQQLRSCWDGQLT